MQYLDVIPKMTEWSVYFEGKPFTIIVIQVYALTSNVEEAEVERFYEGLLDFLEITPQKDVLVFIGDWNANVGSQELPGVTYKFDLGVQKKSRSNANRVLPRERTGHNKHPLTTQEKTLHMDITRWSKWNQIDYTLSSQRWRSSIQSAKTRLGADCGSDHELLIAKFRLKLKKVGKNH